MLSLVQYLFFYPFILRGLYLLRQFLEPHYMNAICLLELVQVSSPEHWEKHPIWKYYLKNITDTCESITGMSNSDYFNHIYHSGEIEYKIFWAVTGFATLIAFYVFITRLIDGRIRSVIGVMGCAVLAWYQGSLFHVFSHFQNDITHINGNVMHHSSFSVNGDNASLVKTLPPGLLINFLVNFSTVIAIGHYIMSLPRFKKLDKTTYFSIALPVIMVKFVVQMAYIHPYIHTFHKSWYAEVLGSWFKTYFMDEYKGHVLCHHGSGYCLGKYFTCVVNLYNLLFLLLGDSHIYSYIYDVYMYIHGLLYKHEFITFKSTEHYLFNVLFDYFLIANVYVQFYATIFVTYYFLPKRLQYYPEDEDRKPVKLQ